MGITEPKSEDTRDQGKRMKEEAIRKRIHAVGSPTGRVKPRGYSVNRIRCQGCGKWILEDGEIGEVEYVRTKRGTEFFFHHRCFGGIWKRGIV